MVLRAHRKPVLARIEARAFWNRPALEHSVELQPKIPVQARRLVLLDDEAVALALELAALGLLRLGEVALAIIGRDVELADSHRSALPRHPRESGDPAQR